jgi:hypothetical protein
MDLQPRVLLFRLPTLPYHRIMKLKALDTLQ